MPLLVSESCGVKMELEELDWDGCDRPVPEPYPESVNVSLLGGGIGELRSSFPRSHPMRCEYVGPGRLDSSESSASDTRACIPGYIRRRSSRALFGGARASLEGR